MYNGINDEIFRNYIADFYGYIEEFNRIQEAIQTEISKLDYAMEGEQLESIKNTYRSIELQYEVVLSNVKSYITDFENVINAYVSNDKAIASDIISDIKNIKNEGGVY